MTPSPSMTRGGAGGALFDTVLVANRGEIACRMIRTLRRLGIRSVAVYSTADREAEHVRMADAAVCIGPAAASESYLDIPAVVAAALDSGAEAVHPGYGFLSENAEFASAVVDAGLCFVGPGVEAIRVMGDKITAKARVAAAGVPVTPSVAGQNLTDDELIAGAHELGFPVLVKPSAGGGGKGMIAVHEPAGLPDALVAARRQAAAAFGDDTLFLERLISSPRHIEVQVLADAHGTVVHLGERECSLQRRHQKVIEEAPSPAIDEATRSRIGQAACQVAAAVGYLGAGTVEFLICDAAPDEFFFMEMNTRLQVEHPVTECVTGIDLVEQQVRVAAGLPLTLRQDRIALAGHAVEARLYAESPLHGFLPTTGTILELVEPHGEGIRVDSGLRVGAEVGIDYDPMLAKVIAFGADRSEALGRLGRALGEVRVLGVETNAAFLRMLLDDEDVRAGRLDTELVERSLASMRFGGPGSAVLAAAALWTCRGSVSRGSSPWSADGWRLGAHEPRRIDIACEGAGVTGTRSDAAGEVLVTVEVRGLCHEANGACAAHVTLTVRTDGEEATTIAAETSARLVPTASGRALIEFDRISVPIDLAEEEPRDGEEAADLWLGTDAGTWRVRVLSRAARMRRRLAVAATRSGAVETSVRTPMPGTVVGVHVDSGEVVGAGAPIVTVEAMKMEHRLDAAADGEVTVRVRLGDVVRQNAVVATIRPPGRQAGAVQEQTVQAQTVQAQTVQEQTEQEQTEQGATS